MFPFVAVFAWFHEKVSLNQNIERERILKKQKEWHYATTGVEILNMTKPNPVIQGMGWYLLWLLIIAWLDLIFNSDKLWLVRISRKKSHAHTNHTHTSFRVFSCSQFHPRSKDILKGGFMIIKNPLTFTNQPRKPPNPQPISLFPLFTSWNNPSLVLIQRMFTVGLSFKLQRAA